MQTYNKFTSLILVNIKWPWTQQRGHL